MKMLSREDRLKAHEARVKLEEEVEGIKAGITTGLSIDELRARIENLKKEEAALSSKLTASDDPKYKEYQDKIKVVSGKRKHVNLEHAKVIADLFRINQRYDGEIERLRKLLLDAYSNKKREKEKLTVQKDILSKDKHLVDGELSTLIESFTTYCQENKLEYIHFLRQNTEGGEIKYRVFPADVKYKLPDSWFLTESSMRWAEWKKWLFVRGVSITKDRTGKINTDLVSNTELKALLLKCDKIIKTEVLIAY